MTKDIKERKEELLKELAEIEAKEKGESKTKKKSYGVYLWISLLAIVLIVCVVIAISTNINSGENAVSGDTFTITDANEDKATKWLKDNKYNDEFDHSDNTLEISCDDNNNSGYIDGMKVCLELDFETKETNNSDYPFELVSPTYKLIIPVKNTYQIISKVIIKTDDDRFELDNESLQTEILSDKEYTGLISEVSISQLKSIADSNILSITMYDDKGDKMYSSDSKEQLNNIKKQIRVGEIFYSLKGTHWTFD